MSSYQASFIKDTKFFFGDFHRGTVNILFHIFSFSLMFYGLANKNFILTILGLAVFDEMGHIYNYFYLHKKDPKYNPVRMFPYQILYVTPVAIILFRIYGLI